MGKKITLMDGATGTRLWGLAEAAGFARAPVWTYNLTHPELVRRVAEEYIAAGSTLLCANTFAANGAEVARIPGMDAGEVVAAGVRIAKDAAAGAEAEVRVALDVGPLTAMLEPLGDLAPADAAAIFAEMLGAGVSAGADCIFLETFTSLEMLRIALAEAKRFPLPVLCSMSFDRSSGRTMMGDSVPEICAALEAGGADAVGMNCSFGPAAAVPIIRDYAAHAALPLILKPNADVGAEEFAAALAPALPLASYLGACCGSDPDYIRALARRIAEAGATG
jgi:5-methyltetrahydrofolate--homocysteine methyltransferase